MKIAMVAGGSGGHIYPALALAEALKEKGHDITFIGSNDRMEKDVIPQNGFDYIGLDVVTTRGSIIQKIRSMFVDWFPVQVRIFWISCQCCLKGMQLLLVIVSGRLSKCVLIM